MEKIITKKGETKKFYDTGSIFGGAFLGGPLVAMYFLAENFKTIGEKNRVGITYIIGILFTIIMFSLLILLPENITKNIDSYFFPFFYSFMAQGLFSALQKKKIDELKNDGYVHHSTWRVLGITLIGLIITLIPVFGIGYISTPQEITKIYGITNNTITTNGISDTETDFMARKFEEDGFFDNNNKKSILIINDGTYYTFYLALGNANFYSKDMIPAFEELKKGFQELFPDKKIKLKIQNRDKTDIMQEI